MVEVPGSKENFWKYHVFAKRSRVKCVRANRKLARIDVIFLTHILATLRRSHSPACVF